LPKEVFNREIYIFYNLPNYTKPGEPIILYNVYDAATAHLIASNPTTQAVATASYGCAAAQGLDDDKMMFEQNLAAVRTITPVVRSRLVLIVDAQTNLSSSSLFLSTNLALWGVT